MFCEPVHGVSEEPGLVLTLELVMELSFMYCLSKVSESHSVPLTLLYFIIVLLETWVLTPPHPLPHNQALAALL